MKHFLRRLTATVLAVGFSATLAVGPILASENTDTTLPVTPILSESHIRYINGFTDQTMRPERKPVPLIVTIPTFVPALGTKKQRVDCASWGFSMMVPFSAQMMPLRALSWWMY